VSGAVSQGDYKCVLLLPSASDLGHLSPISVAQVEIFDVTRMAEEDPLITTFLSDSCFVDRLPFPGEDIDDNYELDFDDFDSDMFSSEQGQPLNLSPLGLPWILRKSPKSKLLTACIAKVDLASHALYAMEHRI
jgi:hypothetical protein